MASHQNKNEEDSSESWLELFVTGLAIGAVGAGVLQYATSQAAPDGISQLLGWGPQPIQCTHKIHKLWLGNGSDEALIFGVGVKYKYITCNTAPIALRHALLYIKKKTGRDLARASRTGAEFGWHAANAALGTTALSSVAMPAISLGALLIRCGYMDSDFKLHTKRFLQTIDHEFRHLNLEVRSDGEVLYCPRNVCRWCQSNQEQLKIEYGGMGDGLKCELFGRI